MLEPDHSVDLPSDTRSNHQEEIQFSHVLTTLCLLVVAAGVGLLLWAVTFSDGLRPSSSVSRDLERIASRMLSFESRLVELSSFEQVMFRLGGQDGEIEEQIRLWYGEMVGEQSGPLDGLYLGILYGEVGSREALSQLVANWGREKNPYPLFRRLLEAGYGSGDLPTADYEVLQARLAEEVPTNWFYFQLAQRLADQSGDRVLQDHLQPQMRHLTDLLLWKWRVLVVCELVLIATGLVFLFYRGFKWLTVRTSPRNPDLERWVVPWTFREGTAVLARGGALTIVLMGAIAIILPDGPGIIELYGFAVLYLPSVVLTSMLLCRPRQCSFLQVVGCSNVWPRLKSTFPLIVMVATLGLIGDWLIVIGGEVFQSSVHWTEWFVPQVVWGSQITLLKIVIEFVVLAPLFEELIFRGILFTTLRKKWSFPIAMATSGIIFAVVHGYGIIAFLTVFWSGCLWAWAYERTGSVIPGMVAHGINNGLVVYSLVAFFR